MIYSKPKQITKSKISQITDLGEWIQAQRKTAKYQILDPGGKKESQRVKRSKIVTIT